MDGDGELAFVEPAVIVLILSASGRLKLITETNAEKAIEELRRTRRLATVLRWTVASGESERVSTTEISLNSRLRQKVPAGCRIIGILSSALRVDQAILTGESGSVEKEAGHIEDSERARRAVVQDKTCLLFSGTVVVVGGERGQSSSRTGLNTAVGRRFEAMKNHGLRRRGRIDAFEEKIGRI